MSKQQAAELSGSCERRGEKRRWSKKNVRLQCYAQEVLMRPLSSPLHVLQLVTHQRTPVSLRNEPVSVTG